MAISTHLKALLRKNWLLWKRNLLGSFLELFGPIIFILLFLVFRYAEPIINVPQTSYYQTATTFTSPESPPPFMKNCITGKNGGKVALAPPDDLIIQSLKGTIEGITTMLENRY